MNIFALLYMAGGIFLLMIAITQIAKERHRRRQGEKKKLREGF